ncbi:hypothetical protein C100_20985 [Sphingobium sp. C100]|nr:hypothetical protein C100_20985 [Sphingobium sp. C100]
MWSIQDSIFHVGLAIHIIGFLKLKALSQIENAALILKGMRTKPIDRMVSLTDVKPIRQRTIAADVRVIEKASANIGKSTHGKIMKNAGFRDPSRRLQFAPESRNIF